MRWICLSVALGISVAAAGSIGLDLDGNGLSDAWEKKYGAVGLDPTDDADGDGLSNLEECRGGTNPFSAASLMAITSGNLVEAPAGFAVGWDAQMGKQYQVLASSNLGAWAVSGSPVDATNGPVVVLIPFAEGEPGRGYYQVAVSDIDADADGLTAYEEGLLGFSDTNANSNQSGPAGPAPGGDFARAVGLFASPSSFALGGQTVTGAPPTLAEASRFLPGAVRAPSRTAHCLRAQSRGC